MGESLNHNLQIYGKNLAVTSLFPPLRLRGCWGTDWPVSEKDSAGHKRETVGLGVCLPPNVVEKELNADKDNYAYVLHIDGDHLTYHISFCSDNESFGVHSAKDWFACLEEWKKALAVKVTAKTR